MDETDTSHITDKRDYKLFTTIVYGVLRHRGTLDYIIGQFSNTRLKKIQPDVLNILRMGLFQIVYLTRIPASAAVNTSVELSKKEKNKNISKFVNAVLRNAIRNIEAIQFPDIKTNPVESIASEKSYPKWLVQKWLARWDIETVCRLCDKLNEIPDITVRTNGLKTVRQYLKESLSDQVKNLNETQISPLGIYFNSPELPVNQLDAFKKGLFQVQDEAAQLVTYLLDPKPGEKILDACSGLGGKTAHIAELMQNDGLIIATDIGEKKLTSLETEMQRLGISIVQTKKMDIANPTSAFSETFDKVIVDAPCSGLGVIRRNPDTKWILSKKNLNRYTKRQIDFLNALAKNVRKGGVLVYAVCSTEPEENEKVKESFLTQNKDFKVDSNINSRYPFLKSLYQSQGEIKTLPHENNMDGFYAVRFIKE
jgi:16S rRNA (cytosine967-C5)-methyltransferase